MIAGLETFAKVRALHDGTTSPGEKASAAKRMKSLAAKAGMTVAEAVSKLDAPPVTITTARTVNMADFFDTPYFREQMAQRECERAERWREVLKEYGTEEAVFCPGPMEAALDAAAERFGSDPGWDAYPLADVPPAIIATVEAAWPIPATVREAWDEFAFWDKLGHDREARGTACGDHSPAVRVRCMILERVLDTAPALSLNDLRARMSWLEYLDRRDAREHGGRFATLRADIERMGQRIREQGEASPLKSEACPPVQFGHQGSAQPADPSLSPCRATVENLTEGCAQSAPPIRRTNADKRRDVFALIGQGLTDREIARRAGVSPTTVGTIRKAYA